MPERADKRMSSSLSNCVLTLLEFPAWRSTYISFCINYDSNEERIVRERIVRERVVRERIVRERISKRKGSKRKDSKRKGSKRKD